LIGDNVTQIGQCADDPVIAPAGVLTSHPDDQLSNFAPDPRPPWIGAMLGTVELLSDEPAIPRENGVGLGDTRDSP
jgi:hypothetical protein